MTSWPWAREFAPETTYLNTASMGLPPARTTAALSESLERWRLGRAQAADYDAVVEECRRAYATLLGVDARTVAIGSQASAMAGLVAASLPGSARVLVAAGDFTSVTFPFFAQAPRGIDVREVPLDRLADAVEPGVALVAVSAVQSADGALLDLDRLRRACRAVGAEILLDLTQAAGWWRGDVTDVAYTVCSGYKWLLAPRGTGYLTVRADLTDAVVPHQAGWFAGEDRWSSIYGAPLRLAADARRFDVSPAWHSWVGAAASLEVLAEIGPAARHSHATGLAARFCAGLGVAHDGSAIVSVTVDDDGVAALAAADVVVAARAGRTRFSFYVNNTEADVDRALDVLDGHVLPD
ncbi:aminotransferase class V [Beutenbergia cavernae DSM 12333]|uniref:Aminotransferase class V n=1 Tax=Beutenbergia cavernae (strain ATCC BAA-8 / DSM 12333 / CCUG 43141 / JCM 11478 / NBRC 16432 / NCIMB 13614 / HKI 0122) TaxID=471853 RepID=C5BZM2_BEUC1|nr:aminotransferase class V-fold PLP-dependent enzyme [Beutenbergia cavernae]ACQ79194.1 aminotransferase class V [Beutenbergia cavernae DSM 12333]